MYIYIVISLNLLIMFFGIHISVSTWMCNFSRTDCRAVRTTDLKSRESIKTGHHLWVVTMVVA